MKSKNTENIFFLFKYGYKTDLEAKCELKVISSLY